MRAPLVLALTLAVAACGGSNGSPAGTIHGTVTLNGATSGDGGVIVSVNGASQLATTDDSGSYTISAVAAGSVTVVAQKVGYGPGSAMVTVMDGQTAEAPAINLVPAASGQGSVSGRVVLFDATQHDGTTVALMPGMLTATSDVMGGYMFSNVPAGTYDAVFTHAGYASQTVHNIEVSTGTFNAALVTLRREATVIGGHTVVSFGPAPNGQSFDLTKVLVGIDGKLFVVPESTGAAVAVSNGTSATGGSFAPDGNRLAMTYTPLPTSIFAPQPPTTLWIGPSDGSSVPKLLTTNLDSSFQVAVFSPDSSHLWFDTTRVPAALNDPTDPTNNFVGDWYSVAAGAPTRVITSGRIVQLSRNFKQVLFAINRQIINGILVEDLVMLDTNAGTTTTLAAQAVSSELDALFNANGGFFLTGPVVVTTVTSTTGAATGDLYAWRPGDAAATKLTAAAIDSNALIDLTTSPGHVFVTAANADGTLALYGFDVGAAPTLRTLVPASPVGAMIVTVLFEPTSNLVYANNTKQLSLSKTAAGTTTDLYAVDITAATSTKIGTAVTHFANATQDNVIGSYALQVDETHFLFATAANGTTFTAHDFDGTNSIQLATGIAVAALGQVQLSGDGLGWAFFAPTPTTFPLTTVTIAGTTATVRTFAGVTPDVVSLSHDGTKVAYSVQGAGHPIDLAATSGAAAPIQITTNTLPVKWMLLGINNDAILYGDNIGAVNNAFRVGVTAGATPSGLGNIGTSPPQLYALADGKRVFVVDANNNTSQIDLPAGTALTRIGTATSQKVFPIMNPAHTRFFFNATSAAGTGLFAAGTTGTALAGPTAGLWTGVVVSPDGKSMAFIDVTNFPANPIVPIVGYAESGAIVPLATAVDVFNGGAINVPGGNVAWIDQVSATDNELCASRLNTPARNRIVSGLGSTTFAGLGTTPGRAPWLSPDGSGLFAVGDANVGAGTPSYTLGGFVFATGTAGTIGTNVVTDQATAATSMQYDPTLANLVYASNFDSLAGSFDLSSVSTGSVAAGLKLMSGAVSWSFSPFSGHKVAGAALVGGQPNLFVGTLGSGGGAIGPIGSIDPTVYFSGDESHVFAQDSGTGIAYAATLGGTTLTEIDDGVIANGLFPDAAGTSCIEIAQHPGNPDVIVGRVAVP